MNEPDTYTLKELAEKCGLTERTTRYYIEKVLPPHHKKGRGKLARYGEDTLNCILFIQLVRERYRFRPGQAKDVLASVPQETIDRVVRGEEELAVATVLPGADMMSSEHVTTLSRPSQRAERYKKAGHRKFASSEPPRQTSGFSPDAVVSKYHSSALMDEMATFSTEEPTRRWQTVFSNQQVRIQCKSDLKLSRHQVEQVEAAAKLIELAIQQ